MYVCYIYIYTHTYIHTYRVYQVAIHAWGFGLIATERPGNNVGTWGLGFGLRCGLRVEGRGSRIRSNAEVLTTSRIMGLSK